MAQFTKVALSGDGSDEFWGGYARFDNPPASLDEYLPRSMVFGPEELGLKAPPASYLDDVILPAANLASLDRILRLEKANRLRNYHSRESINSAWLQRWKFDLPLSTRV